MNPAPLNRPLVVAPVTEPEDLDWLAGAPGKEREAIDVFEFRLDNLVDHLERAREWVASLDRQAVLITARHPEEGGANDLDEAERLRLLRRFLPCAGWMDVELRTLAGSREALDLADSAREEGVRVLGSHHDFEAMPEAGLLEEKAAQAAGQGLDLVKVAVRMERIADIFTLARFVESTPMPVSAMGMGPVGKLSRLVLARAGSVLNYGFLRAANAPGQWPAVELKRLIDEVAGAGDAS